MTLFAVKIRSPSHCWLKRKIFFYLTGTLRPVSCQCNNTSMLIRKGMGEITSPNYPPNEYGKSASCLWEFKPSVDGKNYSLGLTIIYQRLYFVVEKLEKDCSGNYSLFINNDKQDCKRYIGYQNQYVPLVFYDSNSCDAGSTNQSFSPGVTIRYTSKGLLSGLNQSSIGFKILYNFIECGEAWAKATTDTSLTESLERTVNTSTGTTPIPSEMSLTTLIILLLFILIGVSLMVVTGIVFFRKKRLQLTSNTNTAPRTIHNLSEMRNAIPMGRNVTSGEDDYEEVQAGATGEYEAVQPATGRYVNIQTMQSALWYEEIRSTTDGYVDVQTEQEADGYVYVQTEQVLDGYMNVQNQQADDGYEAMQPTTVECDKVQIRTTAQDQESGQRNVNVRNKQAADGYEEVRSTTAGYLNLQTEWLDDGYKKGYIRSTTQKQDVAYESIYN
uniref:uncharacterized protein LOC120331966 isoform X2 n=1 Tax=Styela clava TaxID=7725 RepID=UPI00193964F6|nr:uncharacterized protein LOC120331966 isoform X2 [Styela clava]